MDFIELTKKKFLVILYLIDYKSRGSEILAYFANSSLTYLGYITESMTIIVINHVDKNNSSDHYFNGHNR